MFVKLSIGIMGSTPYFHSNFETKVCLAFHRNYVFEQKIEAIKQNYGFTRNLLSFPKQAVRVIQLSSEVDCSALVPLLATLINDDDDDDYDDDDGDDDDDDDISVLMMIEILLGFVSSDLKLREICMLITIMKPNSKS